MSATIREIVEAHRSGAVKPEQTVSDCLRRIREHGDPAIFISVADEATALAQAREAGKNTDLPLCGVPVAIKDNIDAAGFPTTAACPAYSYIPAKDATAVAKLKAAGAIVIGKTNLDQFATGLVGVRSPYGVPRNPFGSKLIPGGSSSGSAVAVSTGLVPLSLGTDTAGSGRVPAGLNNIVGLKPTLGLVSTSGVVPACRSLDCVSVFSLTADDAWLALRVIAGFDDADSYSRKISLIEPGALPSITKLGVPRKEDRYFFGDRSAEHAFEKSIELARGVGAEIHEIDFSHFLEAARLLYEGPWVAERTAAVGDFIAKHPDKAHPVTRAIVESGNKLNTVDAFRAFYRMQELRTKAAQTLRAVDVLMVPTVPHAYQISELESDPIRLNSNLGTYTNFVNLLDLCGLAIPITISDDGIPYGSTLLATGGSDGRLLTLGRAMHAKSGLPLGSLNISQSSPLPPAKIENGEIPIAVLGAHLSGMALNHELTSLGGRLIEAVHTRADYKLYALKGEGPARPGMLRVPAGTGTAIEAEIWAMTPENFGRFVAAVPAPLSIGTVHLENGNSAKGFLAEAEAIKGAEDISSFGGWRNYVASRSNRAQD